MGGRAVNLRSPLAAVLGRGSSGHGVAHWWAQRVTALALVPLAPWFVVSLAGLPLGDHAAVTNWIAAGGHPVWLALLLLAVCRHSSLGVQVVIEDYVHGPALKLTLLLLNGGAHIVLLAGGVYAVLRIALQGMP